MVAEQDRQRAIKGQGRVEPYKGGRFRARLTIGGVKHSKVVSTRQEGVRLINAWHAMPVVAAPVPGSDKLFIDVVPQWSAAMQINKNPHGWLPVPMALSTLQSFQQKIDCYIKYSPIADIKVGDLTAIDVQDFMLSLGDGSWSAAKRQVIDDRIAALDRDDPLFEMWHKKLKAERPKKIRYSHSIQRQCYAIIRDVLRWALQQGYVSSNVAAEIRPVQQITNNERDSQDLNRKERVHGYELDPRHRSRILHTARNNEDHNRLALRWVLMMEYGLRPGEALGLCVEDYDRRNKILTIKRQVQHKTGVGVVIVPRVKTKSGEREIHVGPDLHKLIMARRRGILGEQMEPEWEPYEFEGKTYNLLFSQKNGRVISQRLDDTYWKKLLISAKVPPVRRYVGRHSAASEMMRKPGVNVLAVSAVMGHSDPAFTQRIYSHAHDEGKRLLAAQIEESSREAAAMVDPHTLYEVDEDRP